MDLLQYRLSDWAKLAELNKCSVENIIARAVTHGEKGNLTCSEQIDFAFKLAEEIELTYMVKATDASGKQWEIGDKCVFEKSLEEIVGFCENNDVIVTCGANYTIVAGECLERPAKQPPLEKLRDEIASYAHSHVPDSVLDGWVKDLTAYIEQQGKDE